MSPIVRYGTGVVLLLALASAGGAEEFRRHDYDLRLEARQQGEELLLTGRVEGGLPCRRLRIECQLSDERGSGKRVVVKVGEAGGIYSRLVEKRLRVKGGEQNWTIEQVDLRCEER